MKKKHLEMMLQQIQQPPKTNPSLEQYMTPAPIAADILYLSFMKGDINNKKIIDLGCGSGIFCIGSALLGAKESIGIDIDKKMIQIAKQNANNMNLQIKFYTKAIQEVSIKCDTILMNPPFGAQKSNENADRNFIEKGFELSDVIYSIHLTKTIPFIKKMIQSIGGTCTFQKQYTFPIKWQFCFHSKEVKKFEVSVLRIQIR